MNITTEMVEGNTTLEVSGNVTDNLTHMLCNNVEWEQNNTLSVPSSSWAVSGLGICGCVFNIFVIFRIISQGLRRSHFSKIYYISLAVADLAVAGCSVGYTFVFHEVVQMKRGSMVWFGVTGTAWVSVTSSLLHVVAITVDRFIATMFPLYYRSEMTHKRVTIAIACIWVISILLVASMTVQYQIAFWCAVIGVPAASFGIMVTYVHIIIITIKRWRGLRARNPRSQAPVVPDDVIKSINTILLGLSITLTYIVCNLPLSVVVMMFLFNKTCPSSYGKIVLHALLTANTVLDPMLYALFDLVRKIMKKNHNVGTENMKMSAQGVASDSKETYRLMK